MNPRAGPERKRSRESPSQVRRTSNLSTSARNPRSELRIAPLRPLHTERFVFGCVRAVFGYVAQLGGKSHLNTANRKADARIRTADPFITSEVLYQLSYVGVVRRPV